MSSNITCQEQPNCADEWRTGASRRGKCGAGKFGCVGTGRTFTSARQLCPATAQPGPSLCRGEIAPEEVAVQLYAEPNERQTAFLDELRCASSNGNIYTGSAPADRPAEEYT